MAMLVVHDTGDAQREIPLGQKRVVIGRRKDCDVRFNDKATSSQHAVIVTIGRHCYLQDLNSTNGTLVNGSPVQKHELGHGDEIQIGRNYLSYVDESDLPKTTVSNEAALAAAPPEPAAQPAAIPGEARPDTTPQPLETTLAEKRQEKEREPMYEPWADQQSDKDMVDSMIDAIRSHRESERTQRINRKESVNQEWKKLIEAARKLKARLAGHPQMKFFDISRQQDEIMIRIQRVGEKGGQHAILLARQHPTVPSPLETIWLIETGVPDRHFNSCERIMRSVLSTLAPLIA
ncbi:MAG: FHA domain-containing protein [Nevskiales bacterium]